MEGICGAMCLGCSLYQKKCKGCKETNGCPFGKKCWIANYIEIGGKEKFDLLKKKIMDEINKLEIEGMPKVEELYQLRGEYVNLEYKLPNGKSVKYLDDNDYYLGTQLECLFSDEDKMCFGIVANMNFILVCEYSENAISGEIVIYKKR